jgi:hypothetical protein
MGIDARIIFKIKQSEAPTDDWLRTISFNLCAAIGAKHFFIEDGLPPTEYEATSKKWHAAFESHRLYPRLDNDRGVWQTIVNEIGGPAPTELQYSIELTRDYSDEQETAPGKAYYQDGETVYAAPDEWLLNVNLWARYYGVGYERGDLMTICAVAEWIEANIPGAVVYYGGDISGVEAKPFNATARAVLRRHYYSKAGREYFKRGHMTRDIPLPPGCGLCIDKAQPQWSQFGFGANNTYAAFACAGCGKSVETQDGGKTWSTRKDD